MKKRLVLPTISVEYFNTAMITGETITMYHLYVNGEFYRAFGSKEDLLTSINAVMYCEVNAI